jgi:hypothetical protein
MEGDCRDTAMPGQLTESYDVQIQRLSEYTTKKITVVISIKLGPEIVPTNTGNNVI